MGVLPTPQMCEQKKIVNILKFEGVQKELKTLAVLDV